MTPMEANTKAEMEEGAKRTGKPLPTQAEQIEAFQARASEHIAAAPAQPAPIAIPAVVHKTVVASIAERLKHIEEEVLGVESDVEKPVSAG